MSNPVIKVENLSKFYRLGQIGGGTLRGDLQRWAAKLQGKPDPLLRIGEHDHGNRSSDKLWALRDINFEVKQGEILGIIGRNGAGKSTLLKILSRITAPTEGRITVRGRVGSLLEVGTGFHPELTGRENVYLNGTILGMKKKEVDEKLEEIIDFSEMELFLDTPVKRYSSGMTVRLAFAVAAHLEPEILIVDEVLAVGDIQFQKKCISKMQGVSKSGRTVLLVSHNMVTIQSLCDRAILLGTGDITHSGPVEKTVRHYLEHGNDIKNSLTTRQDRVGTGDITFTDYQLFDLNSEQISVVITGEYLRIVLPFLSKVNTRDVVFNINFIDETGVTLVNVNNRDSGFTIDVEKGGGKVSCVFKKFPLRGGLYKSNIICKVAGTICDWVKSATEIEVVDGDYFKTGSLEGNGRVVVETDWRDCD